MATAAAAPAPAAPAASWTIELVAGRGRCLIAKRDLPPGTCVMRTVAPAFAVTADSRCAACVVGRIAASGGGGRCERCKLASYCSRACQRAHWPRHRAECSAGLARLPPELQTQARLLLQLRAAGSQALAEASAMEVDTAALPRAVVTARLIASVLGEAEAAATPPRGAAAFTASSKPTATAGDDGWWTAVAPRLLAAFPRNNFCVTDELLVPLAAAVLPQGALLNHSCAPTCALHYVVQSGAGAGAATGSGGGAACVVQEIRTIVPVAAGEELTHSYVEMAQPRERRQEALARTYGFTCRCRLCGAAPALTPDAFLESAVVRDRSDTSQLLRVASGSSGADAVRAAQEVLAALPHGGWRTAEVSAVPALIGAAVTTGLATGLAAEHARANGEALAAMKSLWQSVGVFRGSTESESPAWIEPFVASRLLARSPLAGRTAELGDVRMELEYGEAALRLLRGLLHPHHLDILALTNDLLSRHILVGDTIAAASASLAICGFYLAAFPFTPHHPMLALQRFTAGDLILDLAGLVEAPRSRGDPSPPLTVPAHRWARLRELYCTADPIPRSGLPHMSAQVDAALIGATTRSDPVAAFWWAVTWPATAAAAASKVEGAPTAARLAAMAAALFAAADEALTIAQGRESELATRARAQAATACKLAGAEVAVAAAPAAMGAAVPAGAPTATGYAADAEPCAVRMVEAPAGDSRGRFLVAARDVGAGAQLLEERALIWLPSRCLREIAAAASRRAPAAGAGAGAASAGSPAPLLLAWRALRDAVHCCIGGGGGGGGGGSGDGVLGEDESRWLVLVRALVHLQPSGAMPGSEPRDSPLWAAAARTIRGAAGGDAVADELTLTCAAFLVAVLNRNGFAVTADAEPMTALAPTASFANHSCAPTAAHIWRMGADGVPIVSLISLQPLKTGSEVAVRYVEAPHASKHVRRRLLRERFDFTCHCPRCASRTDDALRFRCPAASSGGGSVSGGGGACDGFIEGYGIRCTTCGTSVDDGEALVDERGRLLAALMAQPPPFLLSDGSESDAAPSTAFADALVAAVAAASGDGDGDSAALGSATAAQAAAGAACSGIGGGEWVATWEALQQLLHRSDAGWNHLLLRRATGEIRAWATSDDAVAAAPSSALAAAQSAWAGMQSAPWATHVSREVGALRVAEAAFACGAATAAACEAAEAAGAGSAVIAALRVAAPSGRSGGQLAALRAAIASCEPEAPALARRTAWRAYLDRCSRL